MPKVILEFDLPNEKSEFEDAIHGTDYSIIIEELDNWLRSKIKHENLPELELDTFQKCRDKLRELRYE